MNEEEKTLLKDRADQDILNALYTTFLFLQSAKPEDRTRRDRIYALCITHVETAYALFNTFVRKDDAR